MKYMTKIEWILEDESFMECSEVVLKKIGIAVDKSGVPENDGLRNRIIDKEIKKKVKNRNGVRGICTCNTGFLCEHRIKYLKEMLNGEGGKLQT